jgi:hypothetical protein
MTETRCAPDAPAQMTRQQMRHRIELLEGAVRIARRFLRISDPVTERELDWPAGTGGPPNVCARVGGVCGGSR